MLKEIIQNQKSKAVIVVVIVILLFTVVYCVIQPKKENNSLISESEEFSAASSDWKITEYLGESVEYHGAEATEAERSKNDKIIKEIKEKYLNKERVDAIQKCLSKYYKFLSGEISVRDSDIGLIEINDIFFPDENYNRYTFFDSNKNGVPELHLSSMREYRILEYDADGIDVIYSGSGYETLLNNGAIFYYRKGGGPEHVSFGYSELDVDNKIVQIKFEKYNTKNDTVEDDLYLFEGKEVTKDEFDKKTKNYMNIDSDRIIWSDYWTFLVLNNNCKFDDDTN